MAKDIDHILRGWEPKPGTPQARLIRAADGRQVIQVRIDLGLMQMETSNRPDGDRPHGRPTYFDYLKDKARSAEKRGDEFIMNEEQCGEADREFMQFYHRRIAWLALDKPERAVADADHTLGFMDFVRDHSPGEDFTLAHEQYRPFVLFHRTQAAAAAAASAGKPDEAVEAIRTGLERMREAFVAFEAEDRFDDDEMVRRLREVDAMLRKQHRIEATLQERLEQAIANEEYETAARIRDELKQRS